MDRKPSVPSTPTTKPRILRRSYLKLLGVSAVPFVTGRTQAAEGRGYGAGGYGEGGYGGIENGDEDDGTDAEEDGTPTIESLRVEDTSGPNPHVDIEVEWRVSHDDDALEEVRVTVQDGNDRPVDDATIDVTESRDSGSETFRIKRGSGETYVITLTVGDRAGNTTSEDATIRT